MGQDQQKNYANVRQKDLKFEVKDLVFLKLLPWKRVVHFEKCWKLRPRYIEPYEIVERVSIVAYCLFLPEEFLRIHNVFHISILCKYLPNPLLVLEDPKVELITDLSYKEQPMQIIDYKDLVLHTKTIPSVKLIWRNYKVEEVT